MSDDDDAPDDISDEDLLKIEEFDAGDPVAVKRKARKANLQARQGERFWDYIFGLEVGRREMFKLLTDANAFVEPFANGPNGFPQPEATWFQWGSASWGKRLAHSWMVNRPEQFSLMLRENDPRFRKDSK